MADEITPEQIEQAEGLELCRCVELLVFGDDLTANCEGRTEDAVCSWPSRYVLRGHAAYARKGISGVIIIDDHNELLASWSRKQYGPNSSLGPFLFVWDNRAGQPWQADLEAHVAAWRAAPRDFIGSGDAERELKAELQRRGWGYKFMWSTKPIKNNYATAKVLAGFHMGEGYADDEATALCRAACLAVLEQRKES